MIESRKVWRVSGRRRWCRRSARRGRRAPRGARAEAASQPFDCRGEVLGEGEQHVPVAPAGVRNRRAEETPLLEGEAAVVTAHVGKRPAEDPVRRRRAPAFALAKVGERPDRGGAGMDVDRVAGARRGAHGPIRIDERGRGKSPGRWRAPARRVGLGACLDRPPKAPEDEGGVVPVDPLEPGRALRTATSRPAAGVQASSEARGGRRRARPRRAKTLATSRLALWIGTREPS